MLKKEEKEYIEWLESEVEELKKQCGYTKGRFCGNCKHFVNISGMGYSFQFCNDERNAISHNSNDDIAGISVEKDGLCNYWEVTDGKLF